MANESPVLEEVAKRIVEALIPGSQVVRRDTGRVPAMRDFDIVLRDGSTEALEVTRFTDQKSRILEARIASFNDSVKISELKERWFIALTSDAYEWDGPREIVTDLVPLLAQLEEANIDSFECGSTRQQRLEAVETICQRFPISNGRTAGTKEQPRLMLLPPNPTAFYGAEDVNEAAEHEANKEDNRNKLGASGAASRHLFIWVEFHKVGVAALLASDGPLPSSPPSLPSEITTVWLVLESRDVKSVIRCTPPGGWERFQMSGNT